VRYNLLPTNLDGSNGGAKIPTCFETERRKGMMHRNGWRQIVYSEPLTAARGAAPSLFALLCLLLSVGR